MSAGKADSRSKRSNPVSSTASARLRASAKEMVVCPRITPNPGFFNRSRNSRVLRNGSSVHMAGGIGGNAAPDGRRITADIQQFAQPGVGDAGQQSLVKVCAVESIIGNKVRQYGLLAVSDGKDVKEVSANWAETSKIKSWRGN